MKMFYRSIIFFIKTIVLIISFSGTYGEERKISSKLNPGCQTCGLDTTLLYTRADGPHDTIHQVWDFSRGLPTMIFVVSSLNGTLDILWDNNVPQKFNLSESPLYSFGIAADRIVEYNDLKDNGYINRRSPQISYMLKNSIWHRNDSVLTDKEAMVTLHTTIRHVGNVGIKLDLLPYKDYGVELPHLIHTANSTLADIRLVNLTTSRGYNSSRFALHFLLVSTDDWLDTFHYTMRKSLDDEHTPGVFEVVEIRSPAAARGAGGWLQCRPVAYSRPARAVASSTLAHVSDLNSTTLPQRSTFDIFYYHYRPEKLLVQDFFVSFGEPGDGFYKQHNFTSWSFTVGYGVPPIETFSLFVVLVISIGLGVPILLAVSGAVYVVTRRCRNRNVPVRFTDDD